MVKKASGRKNSLLKTQDHCKIKDCYQVYLMLKIIWIKLKGKSRVFQFGRYLIRNQLLQVPKVLIDVMTHVN